VKFILVVSCLSAAVVQITGAHGQPKRPWGLERQSTIRIDVPADIRRTMSAALEYDEGEPIKGVAVDLNGDGIIDYLLQSAPSLCGNGGCIYVLCDGASRRKIGQFLGSRLNVLAELAHGYPNIATYSHQSAGSATYTEYNFDGATYVVTAARTMEGAAVDRLFDTLRRVPIWRPGR
jgi:hypothetical protein